MPVLQFKKLLVVVPHSGVIIPKEIPLEAVSESFAVLMGNVDWHTDLLYDFRDILGNEHVSFPYCNLILEANRHPAVIEQSVPLKDVAGRPVYRAGMEPDTKLRQALARKYLRPFHREISARIAEGALFMLDGHSTVSARGMKDDQIELMNYQVDARTGEKTFFCPDMIIEVYAGALSKLLPGITVTVNRSGYDKVYGHVCGTHSTPSVKRAGKRVPAVLQETNQKLYLNADHTPDFKALETLRRAFAEALVQVGKKLAGEQRRAGL